GYRGEQAADEGREESSQRLGETRLLGQFHHAGPKRQDADEAQREGDGVFGAVDDGLRDGGGRSRPLSGREQDAGDDHGKPQDVDHALSPKSKGGYVSGRAATSLPQKR